MPSMQLAIVGTRFRGSDAIRAIGKMAPGAEVRLVREADNQYDSNAVQAWFLGMQVGFIPKQANPRLAAAMDAGAVPTAKVEITPILRGTYIEREPRVVISWGDDT